ncbi:phospholipase A-2-activating protein [Clonorchis sinensis]|uniref:Phospholipase A-2-activating protein n=1 Tax=Clonorchis sinensis TaxID=79923 RepID=G7YDB8_CLOSI|nr:phospholipase A-2-activating protein [Clonorchis sinensis]
MAGNYRFRCALVGHKSDVRSVACLSEQLIASASRDFTARTWYLSREGCDAHESTVMHGHSNYVAAIAVFTTQDGVQWIFTGSHDKLILAYVSGHSEPAYSLKGHEDTGHEAAVWCVLPLPKSCIPGTSDSDLLLATGSADRLLRIWRVQNVLDATGQQITTLLATLHGHNDCIRGFALIDDVRILSASNDASIRAWHVPTGQCVGEFYGHTSYIYGIASRIDLGIFVSSGEDRCVRVWSIPSTSEWGTGIQFSSKQSIPLPCQSAWCVALTPASDVVVGGSDSVVRVFSADPSRQAPEDAIRTYEAELASSKITVPDAAGTGDLDPNKLPGMEALLQPGRREGQVIVVRVSDRSVCYQWSGAETRWVEIGDVVGTGQSKLSVYNGKEYDFVFSVDIVDGAAPLKLPYNRTDDPWVAAQRFIHQHDLPQDYLDTVAQFIIKNAGPKISAPTSNDLAYVDPFTGADRYVPGTTGPTPPSSAASSDQHFPVNTFISLKSLSLDPLITKLKSFNQMVDNPIDESTIALIRAFNFDLSEDAAEEVTSAILEAIPRWPVDKVFPFLDLLRCLVFYNKASLIIFEESHWDLLYNLSLGHAELPQANCLLVLRLLANTLAADAPNLLVSKSAPPKSVVTVIGSSQKLVQLVDSTKLEIRQRKQHQIALAALIHNLAVFSYLSTSSHLSNTDFPYLRVLPSLCVRMGFSLLSLAPTHGPGGVTQFHPDAISTLILGIGTALISASHGDKNVQSEEMIKVHRIRLLASAVSANNGSTEDELAAWESVRRVITYWSQSSACSLKIKDVASSLLRLME